MGDSDVGAPDFVARLNRSPEDHRQMLDYLAAARSTLNEFQQHDFKYSARLFGISPYRLCRIEEACDMEMTVSDLLAYANSLGIEVAVSFKKREGVRVW